MLELLLMILEIYVLDLVVFAMQLLDGHFAVDKLEPLKVANSIYLMKIKHAVITSVDRDDLDDGGASIWVDTIKCN